MQKTHAPLVDVHGEWHPSVPPLAPAPPPRRHRRLLRLAVMLTVVVLGGLVGWNKAATADPGLRFSEPVVFRSEPGDDSGIRQVENRLGREVEIDFARAARFTFVLKLTNEGSDEVKLRDFPSTSFYDGTIDHVSWSWANDEDGERVRAAYEPFEPFSLPAGESVDIRFDARFDDCDRTGDAIVISPSSVTELAVSYKTWGFLRTIKVPFERARLSFFTPGGCDVAA
jgi:hypothetical protein